MCISRFYEAGKTLPEENSLTPISIERASLIFIMLILIAKLRDCLRGTSLQVDVDKASLDVPPF